MISMENTRIDDLCWVRCSSRQVSSRRCAVCFAPHSALCGDCARASTCGGACAAVHALECGAWVPRADAAADSEPARLLLVVRCLALRADARRRARAGRRSGSDDDAEGCEDCEDCEEGQDVIVDDAAAWERCVDGMEGCGEIAGCGVRAFFGVSSFCLRVVETSGRDEDGRWCVLESHATFASR